MNLKEGKDMKLPEEIKTKIINVLESLTKELPPEMECTGNLVMLSIKEINIDELDYTKVAYYILDTIQILQSVKNYNLNTFEAILNKYVSMCEEKPTAEEKKVIEVLQKQVRLEKIRQEWKNIEEEIANFGYFKQELQILRKELS